MRVQVLSAVVDGNVIENSQRWSPTTGNGEDGRTLANLTSLFSRFSSVGYMTICSTIDISILVNNNNNSYDRLKYGDLFTLTGPLKNTHK